MICIFKAVIVGECIVVLAILFINWFFGRFDKL
jgi:hypothetical protein